MTVALHTGRRIVTVEVRNIYMRQIRGIIEQKEAITGRHSAKLYQWRREEELYCGQLASMGELRIRGLEQTGKA